MKKKSWGKDIKCPNCKGPGKSIEEDGRLFFICQGACQMKTFLKTLNIKKQ